MEEEFKSAFDELGEKFFAKVKKFVVETKRFHGSVKAYETKGEERVKAQMIAQAATDEIMELSKQVQPEVLSIIIANTLESFNVPDNIKKFDKLFSPKLKNTYESQLREFNTRFIIENIQEVKLDVLVTNIIHWIGQGYFNANFIDVMRLDINAPQKLRHQELKERWTDSTVEPNDKPLQRWDDVDPKAHLNNLIEAVNTSILDKRYYRAKDFCISALAMSELKDDILRTNITLKAFLSSIAYSCTIGFSRGESPSRHPCSTRSLNMGCITKYDFIVEKQERFHVRCDSIGIIAMKSLMEKEKDKCLTLLIEYILEVHEKSKPRKN